jgi:hypothetical protein
MFLLLDGLDEIPDIALRMMIVRQIEMFTQSYPGNRFIVTSRIVGYREAPLAADYKTYTLADFDKEQIKTFTEKWCPAYEIWVKETEKSPYLEELAAKEAKRLFDATQRNSGVKRLAVNPLLLTILALIQRQGIELPSHRIELFELCATTLLDTWVKAKGSAGSAQFNKNDLIKILRPLAFWMHEHPAVGAIPEDEMTEQLVKQLLERKIARFEDDATRLAEQFLHTVRSQTGILIERGKHRYGFLHLTFEEYFAARELVIRKDRDTFIKKHLHESRWREVILLALGYIGFHEGDEEGITELIQESILKAESNFEPRLHRDLLFAGLCLADEVGVSVECEDDIIERLLILYITCPYDSLHDAFSNVLSTWSGTQAGNKAVKLLLQLLNKSEMIVNTSISYSDISTFEAELIAYCRSVIQRKVEIKLKILHLYLVTILHYLRFDKTDHTRYILSLNSDPDPDVREVAAHALVGQPTMA